MKSTLLLLAASAALVASPILRADDGWIPLFNGKDLSGWKSNGATEEKPEEKTSVFSVEDGKLKVSGGRAHLFYVGPDGKANFKNFELKAKVMTTPGANSGVYFHTAFEE